jgi:hypothetical protein
LTAVKDTDQIGLASEDARAQDDAGQPLSSPIAWIKGGAGRIHGVFVEMAGHYPFGDDFKPKGGQAITLTLTLPGGKQTTATAVTDNNGAFEFANIPAWSGYLMTSGLHRQEGRMPFPAEDLKVDMGGIVIQHVGVTAAPN